MKKSLEIFSFYKCLSQIKIMWCMVPEIHGATDKIFCHCMSFFPFHPPGNQKITILKKWKRPLEILSFYQCFINGNHNDVWFLRYGEQRTEIFVILDYFLPFYPHNNLENENFKKIKKKLEILLFYMCSINDNHIHMVPEIYSTTDTIFCHFGPFLALLPH